VSSKGSGIFVGIPIAHLTGNIRHSAVTPTGSDGCAQQIRIFPSASGSNGSGWWRTVPDSSAVSQVWHTPVRQDHRGRVARFGEVEQAGTAWPPGCREPASGGLNFRSGARWPRRARANSENVAAQKT